jgi:Ras-related protein Rab-39B
MKFIETSAITGVNVDDAFVMMARDIHAKLESGQLRLLDGWDGIKCGGGVPRSGDTLSLSDDDPPMDTSSCFNCW